MTSIANLKVSEYTKICRLCLKKGNNYNKLNLVTTDELQEKVLVVTGVKMFDISLPQQICHHCNRQVESFYKFQKRSSCSDETLRLHYILAQNTSDKCSDPNDNNDLKNKQFQDLEDLQNPVNEEYLSISSQSQEVQDTIIPETEILTPRTSSRKRNLIKYNEALKTEIDREHENVPKSKVKISYVNDSDQDLDAKSLPPTIICKLCDETVNRRQMEYHLNEHNNIFPFPCTQCLKSYSSPVKLRRHAKRAHTFKECVCQICGIVCKNQEILDKHDKIVHIKKYRCRCPVCSQEFSTPDILKRHMMIHADMRPFACSLCVSTFRTRTNLKMHLRTHTKEKIYKCEICDADFGYSMALKKHVRLHVENCVSRYGGNYGDDDGLNMDMFD